MQTATVRQLRNDYTTLLTSVSKGHRIAITQRGHIVAMLTPPPAEDAVDWSQSAAFTLNDLKPVSDAERKAILAHNKGRY
jgi:prevent-host-death family protein